MKKKIINLRSRLSAAAMLLLLTAACGTLSACAGGHSSFTKQAAPELVAETAAASPAMEYAASADSAVERGLSDSPIQDSAPIHPQESGRKLIRTVDLTVETTEFDTLTASVSQLVSDLGGYLENSSVSGASISSSYPERRYASLTARIPSDHLDSFLLQVDTQGNVTNRSSSTQDVTLQYTDVESRKKSLTIEQERLWELLEKADSVDAVIALEARLSEIRYQLESLESQLRTYDNQVDYSTVYLSIQEVAVFTPTSPDSIATRIQKGFRKNLTGVQNGLVNLFVWILSSLPLLIVLAVFVIFFVLIIRLVLSHSSRKTKPAAQHAAKRQPESLCAPPASEPQQPASADDAQSPSENSSDI